MKIFPLPLIKKSYSVGNNLLNLNKQLYLSSDEKHLLLKIISVTKKITATDLTHLIAQSQYAALKINPSGIQQAVVSFNKTTVSCHNVM